MTSSNLSTKLNPVQLHLLEMFSKDMNEEDLIAIKKLLPTLRTPLLNYNWFNAAFREIKFLIQV